ncbi:MAG: hypothetical protein RL702_1509 [Pseudomonadota bacterium]|jgi:small-conductance mechanosensitive channel
MVQSSDVELQALRKGLKEKLGHCLLQAQQYEGILKAIAARYQVTGTAKGIDDRTAEIQRQTLGQLIKQIVGSFLIPEDEEKSPDVPDRPSVDGSSFALRIQIGFPAEDFHRIKRDLDGFVSLRNELVHHFLEQHDLATLDGCRIADETLIAASRQIEDQLDSLRTWAGDFVRTRQQMADHMRSGDFLTKARIPWA